MRIPLFFAFLIPVFCAGQFAPAAGKPGSTAIRHDSSCFVNWAAKCNIVRGLVDISMPDSGYATVGDSLSATGKALENGVLSLGDSGSTVLQFTYPITNGSGWDFAVFENSFLDTFLEFAFVEVSSDGSRFVRFPAESLTDTSVQVSSFGFTKPENIHNLAGKYRAGYGTPFNLDDVKDSVGIDVHNIRFIRITDVVGSMNNLYAQRDSKGRKINDPWPTRFPSSGFDLDAVGVIHQDVSASVTNKWIPEFSVWPNPVTGDFLHIHSNAEQILVLSDLQGRILKEIPLIPGDQALHLSVKSGVYYIKNKNQEWAYKILVN